MKQPTSTPERAATQLNISLERLLQITDNDTAGRFHTRTCDGRVRFLPIHLRRIARRLVATAPGI